MYMKIHKSISFLFLSLIFLSTHNAYSFVDDKGTWKHVKERDGVNVYTKSNDDSPIKFLRATAIVDAPVGKVTAILRNIENAPKWLPRLLKRKYVKNISDQEAVLYDHQKMPWPVSDRELVVHHKLSLSADKKSLELNFKSIDAKDAPHIDGNVVAMIYYGKILFSPKGENKTAIQMTMHIDPKGSIPKWVVNMLQVSMPYDFLYNLNKFAKKTTLPVLPGIKALIDQLK